MAPAISIARYCLEQDLAPLNSPFHSAPANISVSEDWPASELVVHGAEHVRIFIPSKYQTFKVRFEAVDVNTLHVDFEIHLTHFHGLFA